jgi:hypothetical protein
MADDRAYRTLLHLYPRRFRREYGDAMVQLRADRRRDGTATFADDMRDVLRSAPVQHQEAIRTMSSSSKLLLAAIVTAVGIALFAIVGGAIAALVLMLLLAWILTALLRERGARPTPATGWRILAIGVAAFVLAFVVFAGPWPASWREAVPGDVAWFTGFLVFTTSIVLVVAGLLTALTATVSRRRLSR